MRPASKHLARSLVRTPCSRCDRASAFVSENGLCPFCRGEELERQHGLRPGLLRELADFGHGTGTGTRHRRRPILGPGPRTRRVAY